MTDITCRGELGQMQRLKEATKKHPLMNTLLSVRGNPRLLLFQEPLWGIPFYLIAPFVTLYMQARGITDIQIGILLSTGMAIQVVCSFCGGILTDKFGRKKMAIITDSLGWAVPALIWSISGNFWMFLLATTFNSLEQVAQTAWVCLLNEDAKEEHIVDIWSWVLIAGQISVFFAPISGLFIRNTSIISVMRVLYLTFAIFMFTKAFLTYRFATETARGKIRMEETKGQSIFQMFAGYGKLVPEIFKNKATVLTLFVMIGLQCTTMITNNFFSLYTTSKLHVEESLLAIFPIFRAIVVLVFFFAMPKIMDKIPFKILLVTGLLLYTICQIMLIICPPGNLAILLAYAFLEAISFSLVIPRKEAMLVYYVDNKERARILGLMLSIALLISTPCGFIAGKLASIDRQYPFYLNATIFAIMSIVILFSKLKKANS